MAYPYTYKLALPLDNYRLNSFQFQEECFYNGVYWGVHLGEDVDCPAGTEVKAIGRGRVVYSVLHAGTKEKGNWGNIIIVAHKHPKTKKVFFSLYAHLSERLVSKGQQVQLGQVLGFVGKKNSPENGFWAEEHLHFAIYIGPWEKKVLPGYWKKGTKRTKRSYWKEPKKFVEKYKV